ncbi:hypothetical protein RP20_CCG002031 [Aedes albopictus]|nr:hypothetical protein RP20_CCG002031 [Aedes albopictus]
MPCIVPTCAAKAGPMRPFPRQNELSERWIESIQKGCGMTLCLDYIELSEWDVCEKHFEMPQRGTSGQLEEPRQFTDFNGKPMETASCRLCLVFFLRSDLVDTNGKVADLAIESTISELLEIDLQAGDASTQVCIGCLARLEVMARIRNDFLNSENKWQHLMEVAEVTELKSEECTLKLQDYETCEMDIEEPRITENLVEPDEQQEDEQSDEWPDDDDNPEGKVAGTRGRKCYICPVVLEDKSDLEPHLQEVHDSEDMECKECSITFSKLPVYNRHLARHDASERPFKCDYCAMRFNCPMNRNKHHKNVHNKGESKPTEPEFVCEVCEKPYISKDGLFYHLKTKHSIEERHTCGICQKYYRSKSTLETHMQVHTGGRVRKCSLCPQTFRTYSAFYAHSIMHTDRFECKECGKRYPAALQLRAHMESAHSDGQQFECAECPGKLFKTSVGLRTHMAYTHRKNKPFMCDFCSRSFKRKDLLDNHRRIHTGEKPFPCDNCPRRFGSRPTLHHHRKRCKAQALLATVEEAPGDLHSSDQLDVVPRPKKRRCVDGQYVCEFCQKRFLRKEYLANHRRSHTGERPFGCKHCIMRFSDRSGAYQHRKVCGKDQDAKQ